METETKLSNCTAGKISAATLHCVKNVWKTQCITELHYSALC